MKKRLFSPVMPPKPNIKFGGVIGVVVAILLAFFALIQLFRFDKFVPEMDIQLPGGYGFAVFVSILVVVCEIFALPFLLRFKISRVAQIASGLMALLPPWIWLIITIWSTGNDYVAVQFSTYFPLSTEIWTIVFNLLWLGFICFAVWALGFDKVLASKSTRKALSND